ncbi:MAG: DNA-binding transcriptional ArsR family regulator [Granulosicoccus sp.]|jgi:DNA-binding transcriptional ArsR family regulator
MKESAEIVARLLKLLSAPNRLLILCHLIESEQCVTDLCKLVGMKPPAMSQQLSILRREGLLSSRREGQTIFYAIADEKVEKLMSFLYDTYCKNSLTQTTQDHTTYA